MKRPDALSSRRGALGAVLLAAAAAGTGCDTLAPAGRNPAELRRQQELAAFEEQMDRLSRRVDALQMEADANRSDLAAARRDLAPSVQSEIRPVQARLDELERRLRESEAARERDREQILDSLSARMAEILQRGTAGPARRARPRGATVLEHTVKPGESLSRIAAAYGVTVQAIKDENQLASDLIRAGQALYIPEP